MTEGNINAIAVIVIISLLVFTIGGVIISNIGDSGFELTNSNNSTSQTILSNVLTQTTLSPTGDGITSVSPTRKNQTWLDFDGVDDLIILPLNTTISIWYKNSTSDWLHITNSSTQEFINGTSNSRIQKPFFKNDSNIILGKSDSSTFFNGSIDEVRLYNRELNEGEPLGLFLLGR